MSKFEQEIIKLKDKGAKAKEEIKKLKLELKQTTTESEEAKNEVVDLTELNSKVVVDQYKKGPEIQEFLNTYEMDYFNMAYDDTRKFLQAKHSIVYRSFIDIIQNAFIDGEELTFTLVGIQPSLMDHSSFILPPTKLKEKVAIFPFTKQVNNTAAEEPKCSNV